MKYSLSSISTLFSLAALAAITSGLSAQVTTDPVGYVTTTIASGNVPYAPSMVKAISFTGSIVSLSENSGNTTITFADNSFTSGEYDEGTFSNFYLEVTTAGVKQGYVFDIISNGTNQVVVGGLLSTGFSVDGTDQIAIREHLTVGDLFVGATGLSAYADSVKFFNDDGTSDSLFWDGVKWTPDFVNDVSDRPIYPGSGVLCVFANSVDVIVSGSVKTTVTKVPLYAGVNNLVSALSPSGTTLGGTDLVSQLSPYSDTIKLFQEDGSLGTAGVYFSDGAVITSNFVDDDGSVALGNASSYLLSVGSDMYWSVPAAYSN